MIKCDMCQGSIEVLEVVEFEGGVREKYSCNQCNARGSKRVYFDAIGREEVKTGGVFRGEAYV